MSSSNIDLQYTGFEANIGRNVYQDDYVLQNCMDANMKTQENFWFAKKKNGNVAILQVSVYESICIE